MKHVSSSEHVSFHLKQGYCNDPHVAGVMTKPQTVSAYLKKPKKVATAEQ